MTLGSPFIGGLPVAALDSPMLEALRRRKVKDFGRTAAV
jgi:hypothetical protein